MPPNGHETRIVRQPCWPPPVFCPLMHCQCIPQASARSSATEYPVLKGTKLHLSMSVSSCSLPLRPPWASGWCYLICPVKCWQMYSSGVEEGEDRSVSRLAGFLVQSSSCSRKQPPSTTMGSPWPHALPSLSSAEGNDMEWEVENNGPTVKCRWIGCEEVPFATSCTRQHQQGGLESLWTHPFVNPCMTVMKRPPPSFAKEMTH